jgi:nucleoside 2-deoxyribosyltransferase
MAGRLCFVIGPIGNDGTSERKHADLLLNAVVKPILEEKEFGYYVKRADHDPDPGMIGDRVVADVIQADLIIADLTDLNPNALYELGIRHSTEKPTIHIAKIGNKIAI